MLVVDPAREPFMRIFRKSLLFLPAAILGVAVCTGSPGAYARPQSDSDQSAAEAARKAKEQKKKSDKPVKTITDEDIAAKRAAAAKEGAPPEPSTEKAGETEQAPAAEKGEAASTKEEIEKQEAELKELKQKLADAEKDLNLLQRDLTLQKDQFYSKPDFNRDTDGKAKLDGMQNQIRDKQQDVDSLKTRVAALQELVGRAKHETPAKPEAPAKPATPPAPARAG
jgi:predicted RNase H-like nuclease (RuvC/YqgF family)